MLGRQDTGSALGSGAVDAEFWALVCEDEEWLDAEFDAIVSEARETPTRSTGKTRRRHGSCRTRGRRAPFIRDAAVARRAPARQAVAAGPGSASGQQAVATSTVCVREPDPAGYPRLIDPIMNGDGEGR